MRKNIFLSTILVSCTQIVAWGQALVNNPCSNPYPPGAEWTINAPCVNVSTGGMGNLTNLGNCGLSGGEPEGWAWFQGDGSTVDVTYTNVTNWPVMNVWEVTSIPCSVTNVGCDNSTGADLTVTVNTTAGSYYLIAIEEIDGEWGYVTTGCLGVTSQAPPVLGCTDPAATNYNPLANVDDGSCTYAGVDYTHPTNGTNGEKVGACLVTDCGPFVYTDDGANGNYSNGVYTAAYSPNNAPYRVFCPDQAGNCLRVTFNSFRTANISDVLWVRNGPTEFSPNFTGFPTQTTNWPSPPNAAAFDDGLYGDLNAACPFSFTSTDASGCLTFAFLSNDAGASTGWNATIECVPCAGGPNGTDNNDCINATPLCSSAAVAGNSTGPGLNAEGCTFGACPAGGENHTNWYTFTFDNGGTFNFTIDPVTNSDDYDYTLYGPNVTCGALGSPVRCSDAGVTGNTGVTGGQGGQTTEDVTGNGWTETMNVNAGETYFLVIDEWSANSGSGYDLTFGGTATMDCSILPIELVNFEAEYLSDKDEVLLSWTTASERDNDRFEVERSIDGINFEIIDVLKGAGTTDYETHYYMVDPEPHVGVNYYRLNQWDTDGNGDYSEVRAINILDDAYDMLSLFPNPTTGLTELIFNSYNKGEAVLKVVGADGKTIIHTDVKTETGGNRYDLDLSGQQRGVYFVTVTTRDKVYITKLIKE